MNDLDICKRIAEIEGYKTAPCEGYEVCAYRGDNVPDNCMGFDFIPFNPLKDDRLCFKLLKMYKLIVYPIHYPDGSVEWEIPYYWDSDYNSIGRISDKYLNRAICLAIINSM